MSDMPTLFVRGTIQYFKFKHAEAGRRLHGDPQYVFCESTKTTQKKLAERIAWRRRKEIIEEALGLASPKGCLTRLETLADRFMLWAIGDHPKTAANKDQRVVDHFVAFVKPETGLDQIQPFTIERWRLAREAEGVRRSTVQRELNVIKALCRQGRIWFRMPNPFAEIVEGDAIVPAVRDWTFDEPEIYIPTAREITIALTGLPPRYAVLCHVTFECLPRLAEVLRLTRQDLGPDWLFRTVKGGKRKRVAISPAVATMLHAQLRSPDQQFLFPKDAGDPTPPSPESTSSYFTRLFRALGIGSTPGLRSRDGVSHHAFRHAGITRMLDDNINGQQIADLAGWNSTRMLERYGHIRDAERNRAIANNAEYLRALLADAQ
jgi:integrase